jgi:hypothetical protein
MEKALVADTELLEDVCENEHSNPHLTGGVSVSPDVLAKYAGTYQLAGGREIVVTVSGNQLLVQDSATPSDRLFVARSETEFLSSLSQVAIQFVKDGQGAVTHFIRTGPGQNERAARKTAAVQDSRK